MRITALFLLVMSLGCLSAVTHIVDINGSGDFTGINDAILAAADGDSVIVYPGIYYENVDYLEKSITLASLELITGNPAYRDSTIIDGNRTGAAVVGNGIGTLYGFTVQHGIGWDNTEATFGGGVLIRDTSGFILSNCLIKDNQAFYGGGLCVAFSTALLRNTTITGNYGNIGGGALFCDYSQVTFDGNLRCSVYENYAGIGADICGLDTYSVIHVVLDMFTLDYPDEYYIQYHKNVASAVGHFTCDILRGYRQEVNHDLYVSPDGDDGNSGLTPQDPLKTITWALHKIAPDSLNPKTVYVAAGTYSTDDGQIFPLAMKSHTRLIGDADNYPILLNDTSFYEIFCIKRRNAVISNFHKIGIDDNQYAILNLQQNKYLEVSNIIVENNIYSKSGCSVYDSDYILLRNIRFDNVTSNRSPGITGRIHHAKLEDIYFNNCNSLDTNGLGFVYETMVYDSLHISNMSVTNCHIYYTPVIQIANYGSCTPRISINNLLVANNSTDYVANNIFHNAYHQGVLSNSTFVNNNAADYGTSLVGLWKVNNCIFSNNYAPYEIYIPPTVTFPTLIEFRNNLIRNYPNSVNCPNPDYVNYVEGNFDADPSFAGTDWSDPMSYRLNYDSPCIDAGTPDTTGLYLPEFDLFGNPRIYNGIIDIGCYEWDGTASQDSTIPIPSETMALQVYPNPFQNQTTLSFTLPEKTNVGLTIYNIKGQKIRTLFTGFADKGMHTVTWDGTDDNGKSCTSGIYLCEMQYKNKSISRKLILIK